MRACESLTIVVLSNNVLICTTEQRNISSTQWFVRLHYLLNAYFANISNNIVLNNFTSDSLMALCLGIHILHVVLVLQTLFGETETLQTQTLDILRSEFNMGQLVAATALGLCRTKRHRLQSAPTRSSCQDQPYTSVSVRVLFLPDRSPQGSNSHDNGKTKQQ